MTPEQFSDKYGIGVSFDQMYALQQKMKIVDSLVFKDDTPQSDKQKYISGLKYMLSVYITKQISPKGLEAALDLGRFDFAQFIRDYEEAKKTEFERSGSTRNRGAYEKVGSKALDTVLEQMRSFNRPLSAIWADRIKSGASLDDFRAATAKVDENANDVAMVAHRAMETVINERTWGWRLNPFNWVRLYQENKYMRELTVKVNAMGEITREFILDKYAGCVISTRKVKEFERFCQNVKAKNTVQSQEVKEGEKAFSNVSEKENAPEDTLDFAPIDNDFAPDASLPDDLTFNERDIISISPNELGDDEVFAEKQNKKEAKKEVKKEADKLASLKKPHDLMDVRNLNKPSINKMVTDVFVDILEKSNELLSTKTSTARTMHKVLLMSISETWKSPETMSEQANKMFKGIYVRLSGDMPGMSASDKLVAAQKITNIMFNVYSPAASDPKFAAFGDHYSIKNMDSEDIQKLTNCNKENVAALVEDVKCELGVKESIEEIKEEFVEKGPEKAAPAAERKAPVQSKMI